VHSRVLLCSSDAPGQTAFPADTVGREEGRVRCRYRGQNSALAVSKVLEMEWDVVFGFTESQSGRGWQGPLWVI